jgi:CBS domain-containing protein
MKVREVMTEDVVTVSPQTHVREVARILGDWQVSGAPVVDGRCNVLGVVSETDVLLNEEAGRRRGRKWLRTVHVGRESSTPAVNAGEAMTRPPVMIDEDAFVADAARLMLEHRVKRLPVLRKGQLVGIVTRGDLIRSFARGDEEIETEIRQDVLARGHVIPPRAVRVTVDEGRVRLEGEVETPELAESIRFFVERVPGVISVDSHLRSPDPVVY